MKGVRWIKCRADEANTTLSDETLYEGEGILSAAIQGPGLILSFGRWRLYIDGGEDALREFEDAILCARRDHARAIDPR